MVGVGADLEREDLDEEVPSGGVLGRGREGGRGTRLICLAIEDEVDGALRSWSGLGQGVKVGVGEEGPEFAPAGDAGWCGGRDRRKKE